MILFLKKKIYFILWLLLIIYHYFHLLAFCCLRLLCASLQLELTTGGLLLFHILLKIAVLRWIICCARCTIKTEASILSVKDRCHSSIGSGGRAKMINTVSRSENLKGSVMSISIRWTQNPLKAIFLNFFFLGKDKHFKENLEISLVFCLILMC